MVFLPIAAPLCLADLLIDQDLIALNHCRVIEQKGTLFPQDIARVNGLRQSKSTSPTSKYKLDNISQRKKLWCQQSYVVLMPLDWKPLLPLHPKHQTPSWAIKSLKT